MTLLPNFKNFIWTILIISFGMSLFFSIPIIGDFVEKNEVDHILLKKCVKYCAILALLCIIILVFIPTDANLELMVN